MKALNSFRLSFCIMDFSALFGCAVRNGADGTNSDGGLDTGINADGDAGRLKAP